MISFSRWGVFLCSFMWLNLTLSDFWDWDALLNPWCLGPRSGHGRAPCSFSSIKKSSWDHSLRKHGGRHHAISLLVFCLHPSIMLVFGPENNWLKLLLTFCLLSMFDKNVAANSKNDKWLDPNEYSFWTCNPLSFFLPWEGNYNLLRFSFQFYRLWVLIWNQSPEMEANKVIRNIYGPVPEYMSNWNKFLSEQEKHDFGCRNN